MIKDYSDTEWQQLRSSENKVLEILERNQIDLNMIFTPIFRLIGYFAAAVIISGCISNVVHHEDNPVMALIGTAVGLAMVWFICFYITGRKTNESAARYKSIREKDVYGLRVPVVNYFCITKRRDPAAAGGYSDEQYLVTVDVPCDFSSMAGLTMDIYVSRAIYKEIEDGMSEVLLVAYGKQHMQNPDSQHPEYYSILTDICCKNVLEHASEYIPVWKKIAFMIFILLRTLFIMAVIGIIGLIICVGMLDYMTSGEISQIILEEIKNIF